MLYIPLFVCYSRFDISAKGATRMEPQYSLACGVASPVFSVIIVTVWSAFTQGVAADPVCAEKPIEVTTTAETIGVINFRQYLANKPKTPSNMPPT